MKELQESFEKSDRGEVDGFGFGKVRPTRFTWSVKREMKVREAEGALEGGGSGDGEGGEGEEAEEEQGKSREFIFRSTDVRSRKGC